MTLLDILSQPLNQYRQGIVFSLQKGDLDSAVIMIEAMNMVLPPDSRATLPELPLVQHLADDLLNRKLKYDWVRIGVNAVENAISRWVHMNWEKMVKQ